VAREGGNGEEFRIRLRQRHLLALNMPYKFIPGWAEELSQLVLKGRLARLDWHENCTSRYGLLRIYDAGLKKKKVNNDH
jgi:hypothetical protein